MTPDLETLLRAADPLRSGDLEDDDLLARLRTRVDADRARITAVRRSPWPRRLALVAVAAAVLTAVPLVVSAVLPDDPDVQQQLVPAAVAGDGTISCGSGYADPIDPADADLRLLPDRLPSGWRYDAIFARDTSATGWCVDPSLAALRMDASGLVTGALKVIGPIQARVADDGAATATSVDGHPARMFVTDVGTPFVRWLWTDDSGRQWVASAEGLPVAEAEQLLAAVSTSGTRVAWDAARAPGWTLVHLRSGAPYGTSWRGLDWYARFVDASRQEREVEVYRDDVAVPLAVSASVGTRVSTVAGRPALVRSPGGPGQTSVEVEVAPGVTAWGWASNDLPDVERMLASLRQVPRDDPRLERYGTD